MGEGETTMKHIRTIYGLMSCTPPEFEPQTYKGLRSGIGKERKSSKHFKCTKACCTRNVVNRKK
jgi:hypothetical protein